MWCCGWWWFIFRLWLWHGMVWYLTLYRCFVCEKWILMPPMLNHQILITEAVWCAFFILLYKPFPITRQKITYINFSARQITRAARHNLYIVILHTLLVWKNHPAVLPTTYISLSLPGVNDKVYIDWWHAQLQTSKNEIIIKYATFHITKEKISSNIIYIFDLSWVCIQGLYILIKIQTHMSIWINHSPNSMALWCLQSKYMYFHWNIEKKGIRP